MRKGLLASLIVAAMLFSVGCEKAGMEGNGANGEGKNQMQNQVAGATASTGTVATISFGDTNFSVEIADNDETRANGLMNRESLPENNGMWFVFAEPQDTTKFWMKDTAIPLDLVFVDGQKKVVHIVEGAKPQSTEMIGSPVPFQYVLEINAGAVAKNNIKVGDVAKVGAGN